MDLSMRSAFLDKEVRLAIENGHQQVNIVRGSGYLLTSKRRRPGPKSLVMYEIVILLNPMEKRAGALGSIVGNLRVLERSMKAGKARLAYSPERTVDIRILNLEANRVDFSVLSQFGI